MKSYIYAIVACALAAGCSQESATRDRGYDDTMDASPAGSNLDPAEATGYSNTIDPEAFPQTPGADPQSR